MLINEFWDCFMYLIKSSYHIFNGFFFSLHLYGYFLYKDCSANYNLSSSSFTCQLSQAVFINMR